MEVYIILFLILLVDFGWFYVANSKFVKLYPQYNGKYLWTLLFFPIVFQLSIILWDIQILFSSYTFTTGSNNSASNYVDTMLFKTLSNWTYICIPIFAVGTYYLTISRLKLNKLLQDWQEGNSVQAVRLIDIIIGIGIGAPIIYFVGMGFFIYNNDWLWMEIEYKFSDSVLTEIVGNSTLSLVLIAVIGLAVRFFARKKINYLSQTLGLAIQNEDPSYQNKSSMSEQKIEYNSNSISQLKDLKQLLDDGVISEEEFNEMKKGILAKGL